MTSLGQRQAADLGAALARLLAPADAIDALTPVIYTSDLRRAVDTAQAVADAFAISSTSLPPLKLHADPRMRERLLGPFQGCTQAEAARRYPRLWAWSFGNDDNESPPDEAGASDNGGVETFEQMKIRAGFALADVAAAHAGSTTLVVAHGGWITAAVLGILGEHAHCPHIGNTSVTTLIAPAQPGGAWRVQAVGEALGSGHADSGRSRTPASAPNVDVLRR